MKQFSSVDVLKSLKGKARGGKVRSRMLTREEMLARGLRVDMRTRKPENKTFALGNVAHTLIWDARKSTDCGRRLKGGELCTDTSYHAHDEPFGGVDVGTKYNTMNISPAPRKPKTKRPRYYGVLSLYACGHSETSACNEETCNNE